MPLAEAPELLLRIPARLDCVGLLGVSLRAAIEQLGWQRQAADAMQLAVVEAVNNVIEHGGASPQSCIELRLTGLADSLRCELRDGGQCMPEAVLSRLKQQTLSLPEPSSEAESGYGLALMQALVDELHYESREGANMLRLVKYR